MVEASRKRVSVIASRKSIEKAKLVEPQRPPPEPKLPVKNVESTTEPKTKLAIKKINPKLITKIPGKIGEGTFGKCYCALYRNIKVCVKEYKSNKEMSTKKLRARAYREVSIIFDLGDHSGLPMVFGISTNRRSVMLISQFHGEGEQNYDHI